MNTSESTPFQLVVDAAACAACGAAKGERCVRITENGTRRPIGHNHGARLAAADELAAR